MPDYISPVAEWSDKLRRAAQLHAPVAVQAPEVMVLTPVVICADLRDPGYGSLNGRRWCIGGALSLAAVNGSFGIQADAAQLNLIVRIDLIQLWTDATAVGELRLGFGTSTPAITTAGGCLWVDRADGSAAPVLSGSTAAATGTGTIIHRWRSTATGGGITIPMEMSLLPGAYLWITTGTVTTAYFNIWGRVEVVNTP